MTFRRLTRRKALFLLELAENLTNKYYQQIKVEEPMGHET
jgi:hypothetical protein